MERTLRLFSQNMIIDRKKMLSIFILVCLLFPQFPPLFGRSEVHINLVAILFATLSLTFYKLRLNTNSKILILGYFFSLQLFLFLSYWLGTDSFNGFSDLPSYYRPLMLLFVTLGFLSLIDNLDDAYSTILRVAKIIITLVFCYSILEVFFFDIFSSIMFAIYRIEDKSNINGVAVSFFTLPYYASYILSVFLPLLMSNYKLERSIRSLTLVFMCFICIILTQSKMGVFLALGIAFLYWYLSVNYRKKIIVVIFFGFFLLVLYLFLVDFISYLNSEFGGNFLRTLHSILSNTEHAHNLLERVKDITETYSAIMSNNPFFGVGLAKGKTIEVWIAMIMYRYGLIGLMFFVVFFLWVGFVSIIEINKENKGGKESFKRIELLKMIVIWSLTIFISQLSGLMIEMSKGAIISSLMFALTARVLFIQRVT
ncbi:O-antigen ligase family protein [Shewanella frigidimarina]|uniref:O-antigen ligase family protein n=1 Tax=Shewanella frigidimarina TaxID=56812 RepID=UPI003D7AA6BA